MQMPVDNDDDKNAPVFHTSARHQVFSGAPVSVCAIELTGLNGRRQGVKLRCAVAQKQPTLKPSVLNGHRQYNRQRVRLPSLIFININDVFVVLDSLIFLILNS